MTIHQRKEHAADYFATCLVMPRLWVERYWKRGDMGLTRFDGHPPSGVYPLNH